MNRVVSIEQAFEGTRGRIAYTLGIATKSLLWADPVHLRVRET